jgi:hypothetical protein
LLPRDVDRDKDQVPSNVGRKKPEQPYETIDVNEAGNETKCDRKGGMLERVGNQMVLASFIRS